MKHITERKNVQDLGAAVFKRPMTTLGYEEARMFFAWYGQSDLANNDVFWLECAEVYKDRTVVLPIQDDPLSRSTLAGLLKCTPGTCGLCCEYEKLPLSDEDIALMSGVGGSDRLAELIRVDAQGEKYWSCKGGCPLMVNKACTVYAIRPRVCADFPIQIPLETTIPGRVAVAQVRYRLRCLPALEVVRTILRNATASGLLTLLPDLSLLPTRPVASGEPTVEDTDAGAVTALRMAICQASLEAVRRAIPRTGAGAQ